MFTEIVQGPEGTWRAVEAAGRGIAAEARCALAILPDKLTMRSGSADELLRSALASADRLMELGAIEDDLSELWSRRREGDLGEDAFEASLQQIVTRLEAWPQSWSRGNRRCS
ncbi:hypothetical protein ACFFMM_08095 [Micromonospora chaiyaphumensis]|uniref:hypothetical protein n=1 Tax=Micromonospora chaiyaphumensis TaxID=307119 RepID=UPI000B853EC7|nr:hypothetical protein [Micromonospora chaiyaphumensis]